MRWIVSIAWIICAPLAAQPVTAPLNADGSVPVWLTAGPFEQPTVGFGFPDDTDLIAESDADPAEGEPEASPWTAAGIVTWRPAAPDDAGFVDFHAAFADVPPGDGPEKIWWSKVGYAYTTIESATARDALLLLGSNSSLKVVVNGETVLTASNERNAVADEDTVRVRLQAGTNRLLVKVGQTHRNEGVQFFVPLAWQWGFYARLVTPGGTPVEADAAVSLRGDAPEATVASSMFFRETEEGLRQRYDLTVTRRTPGVGEGNVRLTIGDETLAVPLNTVPFGLSRHELWGPPIDEPTQATLDVATDGGAPIGQTVTLEPQPRYELHLMLNSHTDVGYTHPQPTVAEKHALLLDEVIARAEAEPDFAWTIETIWQLEQFVEARAPEQVERLMALIRAGRVAVAPVYANPFTGWISEEELLHSFTLGEAYAERFGFDYTAALSNDVPGFAWMLPSALRDADLDFFVTGLNEVYGGYAFQQSLPKAFQWEGADGSTVLTYRTEAYNEGQSVGLVKGPGAVLDRLRERLLRLRAQGNEHEVVLLNTTFADNGGIPNAELATARAWNEAYAYPRIVISTLDRFVEAFTACCAEELPTVRGDWISNWDVLYQGELARVVRQRWAQHRLPLAEAMSTAAWLSDGRASLQPRVDDAYHHLLQYSAHGSGLEHGYGGPDENAITMAYREGYVQGGLLATEAVLQRAMRRLVQPMESFETEAIFAFNAMGVARDVPLAVEFAHDAARYRVVDGATGEELPSFADGYHLHFVARDLPAVGYKKLRLEPRGEAPTTDLRMEATTIENSHYRLTVDPSTGQLASALDKRSGTELVRADAALPFGLPVRAEFGDPSGFASLMVGDVSVTVHDERPARLRLTVEFGAPDSSQAVVPQVAYTLWENLDRVEVEAEVDLEALAPVEVTEEYGLPFPFALDAPTAHLGLLGGFADPTVDRFAAFDHDAFSLRQSLALTEGGDSDAARSLSWAAADSRVVKLRETPGEAAPTVVAVLANHFPPAWNRNEENEGVWPLRFAFTHREGAFDAAFTDHFGRAFAQPAAVYPTWLAAADPARSFLTLDGDSVHLLAFQPAAEPGDASVLVRLKNPSPDEDAAVRVSLPGQTLQAAQRVTFLGDAPTLLALDGGTAAVRLGPNEMATLRLHFGTERADRSPSPNQPTR
ncbi:MAG: hypothetical protein AAGG50_00695 [Bacteroidota bacterium]